MDKPWEGNSCAYMTVFKDGDLYRMYYRGSHAVYTQGKIEMPHFEYTCYAESGDGITWNQQSGTEECDDGDSNDQNDCTNACEDAECGDGITWSQQSGSEDPAISGTPNSLARLTIHIASGQL